MYSLSSRTTFNAVFQGILFTNDFLCESVVTTFDWQSIDDATLGDLEAALRIIFEPFPIACALRSGNLTP